MNVNLLTPAGQAAPERMLNLSRDALINDLELDALLEGVSNGDSVIEAALRRALFAPLHDPKLVEYRHAVLQDAMEHPTELKTLYDISLEAEKRRKAADYWRTNYYLTNTFTGAIDYILNFTKTLLSLRQLAEQYLTTFRSEGFLSLFRTLREELSDEYLNQVRSELGDMHLSDGVLMSAGLDSHLQTVNYQMHKKEKKLFSLDRFKGQSYQLQKGDDATGTDITNRYNRAINEVTNALAQSAEYLAAFFDGLRGQLAFYMGCLNFMERMRESGMPVCIPEVTGAETDSRKYEELYDISLVFLKKTAVKGNTLDAAHKKLYIVTGANKGGKTTFLRSLGQAQLMAQCGMPVAAKSCTFPVRGNLFTHFKREEDKWMKSGKLDEELERMSKIADYLHPGDLIMFNEAFSSTNEREGSEIARQITDALTESGVEVFFVSHQHAYASAYQERADVQFLRAERLDDGSRTFRLLPGAPLETAFGEDLYQRIFGEG